MTKTSFYTTIEIKIPIMIFVCLSYHSRNIPIMNWTLQGIYYWHTFKFYVLNYRCYGGAIQESSMGGKPTKGDNQKKLCMHIYKKIFFSPCQ